MKTFAAAVLFLLASNTHVSAQASYSIQNGKRVAVQPACASMETGKGESKFNGQIYSAGAGSFGVAAGKELATVSYNNSVLVCENGQIANTGALLPGATVEVIGPMSKKGDNYVFEATKVFISAAAPAATSAPRQGQAEYTQGTIAGSNVRGNSPGSSVGQGNEVYTQDSITGGGVKKTSSQGNAITCNALQFEVSGAASTASGAGARRTTVTPITCRRTVDQETMEFVQDAITAKRLAEVTLSWQGTLVVTLTNADISSVTFASDTTGQIVEIAFASERAEIVHTPSGTKVTY